LTGIGDVRLDLLDRVHVDQRADHGTRLEPVGDLHRPGGLGEMLGESVVDAILHRDAVGAHAGLSGIAIFRGDGAPCLRRGKLLTAISISASSKTMNGALPPNSSESFLTVPAHCSISNLPTSVEPVKVSLQTIGCEISSPTSFAGLATLGSVHTEHPETICCVLVCLL
jgi:hypothetical protein